ncbi:MAG: hypothetical protein ABSG53_15095, partial [Thermoguttaceae bacterium]
HLSRGIPLWPIAARRTAKLLPGRRRSDGRGDALLGTGEPPGKPLATKISPINIKYQLSGINFHTYIE